MRAPFCLLTPALLLLVVGGCAPARAGERVAAAEAVPVSSPVPAPSVVATPSAAVPAPTPAAAAAAAGKEPIQRHKNRLRWIEGPATIKGSRMAILEGNPKEPGAIYTLRLSVIAGTRLAPHYHPQDERVTVLEGSLHVGFGDVEDTSKGTRFQAGDFYVNPAGSHHYVWADEPATVQITGVGPWDVVPVSK